MSALFPNKNGGYCFVYLLQQVCFIIKKTTIINQIRLLACERFDRASIISSYEHVTFENGAPVQFNALMPVNATSAPTCLIFVIKRKNALHITLHILGINPSCYCSKYVESQTIVNMKCFLQDVADRTRCVMIYNYTTQCKPAVSSITQIFVCCLS